MKTELELISRSCVVLSIKTLRFLNAVHSFCTGETFQMIVFYVVVKCSFIGKAPEREWCEMVDKH